MKPCSQSAAPSSNFLQVLPQGSVIAKITGSIKQLGSQYRHATVALYSKLNLQPIVIVNPDENGNYSFLGLNSTLKTFIVAFDNQQQYNAVIQDNVVPK